MKNDESNRKHDFDEYLRQGEPLLRERAESWKTAIGLQAVDGLTPSPYLVETAKRHIEGDISIDDVKYLIDSYYQSKPERTPEENGTEEADKVSANITRLLNEKTFTFSPIGYISIHRRIFDGVLNFAGQLRDYNITKKEWVLHGDTVLYASAAELLPTLEYDFDQESKFDYKGLSADALTKHITKFVSGLWQIHAFGEGNTRTTAVFTIKYLRAMGFNVNNDIFADNAWYFRNALVRANYRNYQKNIEPDLKYLERFFRNLLLGEQNVLKNRLLRIDAPDEWQNQNTPAGQIPGKHPTSTRQAPDELTTDDPNILQLVRALGEELLSIREMLAALNLRDRENLVKNYLTSAIRAGYVSPLYPETPRHPRQKYRLAAKGVALFQKIRSR